MSRLVLTIMLAFTVTSAACAGDSVKVFILAGQSNMEGHGKVDAEPKANEGQGSLEWLVKNPATAARFKHLVDKDGEWTCPRGCANLVSRSQRQPHARFWIP